MRITSVPHYHTPCLVAARDLVSNRRVPIGYPILFSFLDRPRDTQKVHFGRWCLAHRCSLKEGFPCLSYVENIPELEVEGKPVGECSSRARTYARADGRTDQKHNASGGP